VLLDLFLIEIRAIVSLYSVSKIHCEYVYVLFNLVSKKHESVHPAGTDSQKSACCLICLFNRDMLNFFVIFCIENLLRTCVCFIAFGIKKM